MFFELALACVYNFSITKWYAYYLIIENAIKYEEMMAKIRDLLTKKKSNIRCREWGWGNISL